MGRTTHIILAAFLIAVAVFGGICALYLHSIHGDLEIVRHRLGPLRDLPDVVALPDNSPPTCERSYQATHRDGSTYVEPKLKVDGSACVSSCLSSSASQICIKGVCTGACAGECPSNSVSDCPVLKLATAVNMPGMNTFKLCVNGKCLYFITNPQNGYIEYIASLILHYADNTITLDERLGQACLDFIDDTDPAKSCLQATFVPADNVAGPSVSSMCLYSYECSRYSVYAGIGDGTYTLASSPTRNGQPSLTIEKIKAAAESAQATATKTSGRSFQPITLPSSN